MKKYLLAGTVAFATALSAVAHAETDNRSASAKAQDMYVEPTIRVTTQNLAVTPQQAQAAGVKTFQVPQGTANSTETRVYNSKGQQVNAGQAPQQQRTQQPQQRAQQPQQRVQQSQQQVQPQAAQPVQR